MPTNFRLPSFTLVATALYLVSLSSVEVTAAEYQCRKLDSSVRLAVEVKKAGHTLPCEVIAEDDRGDRAVLYSAQFDRDYCPARIERTRSELEQDGWQCEQTSLVNVVTAEDGSPDAGAQQGPLEAETGQGGPANEDRRTVAAVRQCRQGNAERRIQIEVEKPSSGTPCELIYWSESDRNGPGQLLWRAEHDAGFCTRRLDLIIGKWAEEGWNCETVGQQVAALQTSDNKVGIREEVEKDGADAALKAIVMADAERIGEWMDVEPAIEIAGHGDLNEDGNDDAVVFIAYQSQEAAYRQYLMSYLATSKGYELASVKLLTNVSPPPDHAQVKEVDKGIIWLAMPDEQRASLITSKGYRLRNQELVEITSEENSGAEN